MRFLQPVFMVIALGLVLPLFADWGIRVNINGSREKISLVPAPGSKFVQNIQWGGESERSYALFAQKKGISDDAEELFEVSFVPEKDGSVFVELSGCYVRSPGMSVPDRAFVEYRNIQAQGTVIRNGDFSVRDSEGSPRFWNLSGGAFVSPRGVQGWQNGCVSQQINVVAGKTVTLRIQAVKGLYEKARPSASPLVFRHGGWSMSVDGDTGAWLAVDHHGKTILRNPASLSSFSLQTPGFPERFKLTAHSFSPENGELSLTTETSGWRFTEHIQFGRRLRRTLTFVNTGKTAKNLSCVHFFHYFANRGRYCFPGTFFGDNRGYSAVARDFEFEPHRSGFLADMKNNTFRRGVFDCYFMFLEPEPGNTVMLAFDGRTDMSRASLRSFGSVIRSETYIAAAGRIRPGVPQKVGPMDLEVISAPLEQAMRSAPAGWFRDVGMLPPEDRPDWVRDASLYVTLPSPVLGSAASAADGAPLLRRIAGHGFNTLWLLPPYHCDSLYSPNDFYRIRRELGSFDDYRNFIATAKRGGFRVWQDIIPHGGLAGNAGKRGVSPWTLVVQPDGQFRRGEAFDYGSKEWRDYMLNVMKYYMEKTGIDGFRVDQCGFSWRNWRDPDLFRRNQTSVDPQWLKAELAKTNGEIPPLETRRPSDNDRITSTLLTGEMRRMVRSIRKDASILAETVNLSCVPVGDAIYDFWFRRFLLLLERFGAERSAQEISRFLQEQKDMAPPGTLFERFVEIHDAFPIQSTSWVGEGAGQAVRAMMFFSQGIPSILHGADAGRGTLLARLNRVRSALPEMRRGTVEYQTVSSTPAVFAAHHTLPGAESVAAVSFYPAARKVRLKLPQSAAFAPDTELEVYESMSGQRVGGGKTKDLRNLTHRFEPFGYAVFTFRPANTPAPVPPEPPLPTPAVPVNQPEILRENGTVTVAGSWPLVVDEASGRLVRFGPYIGSALRFGDSPDRSRAMRISVDRDGGTVRVTAAMDDGGTLLYTLKGNELTISAELRTYRKNERSALLLPVKGINRWQVFTAEGVMDDRFDPRSISDRFYGALPQLAQSRRPFLSPVLWQSTAKPLDWNRPVLRFFDSRGGVEISFPDVLGAAYDDLMLLSHLSAKEKTPHVAAFWVQPGPLSLADGQSSRKLKLRIRPVETRDVAGQTVRTVASVRHESTLWRIANSHFEAEVRRNGGGLRRLTAPDGSVIAENQDIRVYEKGNPPAYGRTSFDPETSARYFIRNGRQYLRFASLFRTAENSGIVTPYLWNITEYEFGSGPVLRQNNFLYASSPVVWTGYFYARKLDRPEIVYSVREHGDETRIPLTPHPGRYSAVTMEYSVSGRKTGDSAEPPERTTLPANYPFSGWITGDSVPRMLMIGEQHPGNTLVNWSDQNYRLVPGHKTPAAVQLHVPAWCNIGPELDLKTGKYRVKTRFRTQDFVKRAGRFWLELRLEYEQNGRMKRLDKRYELPEGSLDWTEFSADFAVPADVGPVCRVVLAAAVDGEGDGILTADLPEIEPLRQNTGISEAAEESLRRAIASFGGRERRNRFPEKAERGENQVVGVSGGSVPQGPGRSFSFPASEEPDEME